MTHDIVVLGAGPAGSVVARRLAAGGVRVALVGAASRPGWEGLSARSGALLAEEGLETQASFIAGPYSRRGIWADGRSVEGVEWLVERSQLAEALRVQAQAGGADTYCDTATVATPVAGQWRVCLRAGGAVEAPLLVDARGRRGAQCRGPLLLAVGQRFRRDASGAPGTQIHATDFGWCWWAQRERALWVQVVARPRSAHPAAWRAAAAAQVPALALALTGASPEGDPIARPAHARLGLSAGDPTRWRVGDAAMALDPLSGQGVYEALRGARLVATAIQSILDGGNALLAQRFVAERYEEAWQRGVRAAAELYRENSGRGGFWGEAAAAYAALTPARSSFVPRIERRPVLHQGRILERDVIVTPENPRGVWHVAEVPVAELKRHFESVDRPSVAAAALALHHPQAAVAAAIHWLQRTGAMPRHDPAFVASGG